MISQSSPGRSLLLDWKMYRLRPQETLRSVAGYLQVARSLSAVAALTILPFMMTAAVIARPTPQGQALTSSSTTPLIASIARDTFTAQTERAAKHQRARAGLPVTACEQQETPKVGMPFADCPSFSLDFKHLPDGPLGTQVFNTYVGKPEANQEAQYYTSDTSNVRIENGTLVLTARNDPRQGYRYTSARINTQHKKSFMYGKLVVRATIPKGTGTWPAIWMLPANNRYFHLQPPGNPSRNLVDGEIDMAEAIGTEPNTIYGIAHSLGYPNDGRAGYYGVIKVPGNDTQFHDYGLNWTPTSLTFTLDGVPYFSMEKRPGEDYRTWPYDQPYYLIMNVALGGTWGGTDRQHFPVDGVDSSALPASMKVQSVRYYPYAK